MSQFGQVPLIGQLRGYSRTELIGDLGAGLTVGVMLIPQGMAYALIAGMPPIYGLYAALVPIVVYAILGTSRQLAVGPVAMISLLVASGVAPLAGGDPTTYIQLALLLSLLVGVVQLALGLVRFGFLASFLSHPVLAGFTSAAALIIGLSQLKHLLGIDIERSHLVHEILWAAVQQAADVHGLTLVIGLAAIILLVLLKRVSPRVPGALIVVAVATVAVWLLDLSSVGVKTVGAVPGGLPRPSIVAIDLSTIRGLLPAALTISLVAFMESYAVARVYARKNKYAVDPNRELVALGAANIAGSFFQSFPTTGGFSRTAVSDEAGARTTVAGLVAALIIAITLLLLTKLFFHLPNAVLAAIVLVAVYKLIDFEEARFLWRADRTDFVLMAVTFLATLLVGIEQGILIGLVSSLIVLVAQTSKPHTAVVGRLPGTQTFRNVLRNPDAITAADIVVFRFDSSLTFANADFFKDRVRELAADRQRRTVVFDFYPVNRVDSTGVHALSEIIAYLRETGLDVWFSGVKGPVADRMKAAGLEELVGADRFCSELTEATRRATALNNGVAVARDQTVDEDA